MSLTPETWGRISALFDELRAMDPAPRRAKLAALELADPTIVGEVAALLDADTDDAFLEADSGAALLRSPERPSRLLGRTLGAYRVDREIGRGGMGVVYEGRHADPSLDKRVAIKTLAIGLDRPELVWRFRRERQILARLEHPNIAALYDGGTADDGMPYLVMEYVDGLRIDAWCDRQRLTIPERLDLFRQVCGAVQFAHTKLIVHRDLKPNNILVTHDGVVKLLDFGIAKLAAADDGISAEQTEYTRAGAAPLTTAYASPEQVRGEEVTTASDVYSLGVILYRLLTGTSPYAVDSTSGGAARAAISATPVRTPSDVVTEQQPTQCQLPSIMALRDRLRGDLDAIVLKALRPEPERRYASVEAFRTDVLRYLKGLPVLAKADTLRYRLAKFVRRQRTLVASASVVLVALIAATLISVRSARSASAEAGRARRMVTFLQTVVGAGDASFYSVMRGSKDITLRELLDSTAARVPESFRDDPRTRADLYSALARSMRRFNRYELTLALLDSALALHEATVGALSNEVATDLTMKSFIDTDLSRETEAVALLRRALGIFRAVRSPSMADFTVTQTAMGELYLLTLGQPDSGLAMLRPALARELASASARPQLVGKIHQLIGVALSVKGDTIGGDSAFARSVRTLSADSLRESEQLSYALVNWGAIYSRRRRFADAIERTRHALRLIETAYGPTHLRTATVQSRLADEYMQLGMFTAARPVIDSALTAFRSLPTRNASEIADALRVRARVQLLAHEYAAASQSIAEARRILPELEEDRAEHDLDLQWVEARILEATGDTAAEHRVLQASVAFTRKHFGQDTERMRVALGKLLRFDSLQATKPH